MALMLDKTYDALIAAGAPEDKARDAAEETPFSVMPPVIIRKTGVMLDF